MEEKKAFKNIVAGIVIVNPSELKIAVNGERLGDYEAEFTDWYYDRINDFLRHKRWGVFFKQFNEESHSFIVDIFTENNNDYAAVYNIIYMNKHREIKLDLMPPYWNFLQYLEQTGQQFPE